MYEYMRPSWEERARPVVDEAKLASFGSTVPGRPLNPNDGHGSLAHPLSNDKGVTTVPRYIMALVFLVLSWNLSMMFTLLSDLFDLLF